MKSINPYKHDPDTGVYDHDELEAERLQDLQDQADERTGDDDEPTEEEMKALQEHKGKQGRI